MNEDPKVRENRLRRIADRRGYRLEKSARRDPKALDFSRYRLIDVRAKRAVLGSDHGFSATIDEVEAFLDGRPDQA
jgi:hypothetical protein